MKPELIEIKGDKGEHLNWRLIDTETNEIIWEEWSDNALGKMEYDFENSKTIFTPNPNLPQ